MTADSTVNSTGWGRLQELGWFDVDQHSSGAVASRLATDAAHLRGAVGDQVALVSQNLVTVIAGFTIGARPLQSTSCC